MGHQTLLVVIVFALIVIAGVGGFLGIYGNYNDRVLYRERLNQMKEVTCQLFDGLEDLVENQWSAVDIDCNYLETEMPSTVDELHKFMLKQTSLKDLDDSREKLVAIDNTGKYYTIDGAQGMISEMDYLLKSSDRISFVSKAITNDVTSMFFLNRLKTPLPLGGSEAAITYYGTARNMQELNPYFVCGAYNGNNSVNVLRANGERVFSSENSGLIKGYNAFSVMKNMKYLHGSSFGDAQKELTANGIAYSNVILGGEKYFYSIYRMKNTNWTLLFLVPSDCVGIRKQGEKQLSRQYAARHKNAHERHRRHNKPYGKRTRAFRQNEYLHTESSAVEQSPAGTYQRHP